MPINYAKSEVVQARITQQLKLKIAKYQSKNCVSEGEVVRLALKKFLHNVTTK